MLDAQLSACRVDIAAMLLADGAADARFHQRVIKHHRRVMIDALESLFIDGVVRDEVDIGIEPAKQLRQLPDMLRAVIDAAKQDVLERQPAVVA